MKDRAPAFQFFPRQFAGDDQVMGMDLEAIGAHILLMCAAASSPERYRIPADEYAIRMRLRNPSDEAWLKIKKQLLAGAWKVSEHGQWWIQSGLERTFQKQKEFSNQQSARAQSKWRRQSGQAMPIFDRTDAADMPIDVPDACSSSSSSSSNKNIVSEACGSGASSIRSAKSQPVPTEVGLCLADLLKQRILQNNPNARLNQAQVTKWAIEVDRMIRLDGRTEEEIRKRINWSQSDPFWHNNILSMSKLREQFDRLTLLAQSKTQNTDEPKDDLDDVPRGRPQWPGLPGITNGCRE
jgi:hypothetical protein